MSALLNPNEVKMFKELLDGYQSNKQILSQFQNSRFGVIAGPVAAGKDTLRNMLLERPDSLYVPVLSTTTRPPRAGEIDRRAYHFSTVWEVAAKLKNGECLQGALIHNQQVSVLDSREIRKLQEGQIGLSILIVQTEISLFELKEDMKTLFLTSPNLKIMLERIRGDRTLAEPEIYRRLEAAKKELSIALQTKRYYCLVSDEKQRTANLGHLFFAQNERDVESDEQARKSMVNLLQELEKYLS